MGGDIVNGAMRCRSSDRSPRVRSSGLTGIDYVDYQRDTAGTSTPTLILHLLGPAPAGLRKPTAFLIEGGRRISDVQVMQVKLGRAAEGDPTLILRLDREGDASTYTVRIVADRRHAHQVPDGVDPRYDRATFSFKLDCPSELDCAGTPVPCPAPARDEPVLDYLARDYASLRQLLLDRLSLTLPGWRERHAADVGVALVELMALVGDHLAYRQDVIATEAYLDTARLRRSLRRHARLVDYRMHEGTNARAWVTLSVPTDVTWRTADLTFYTRVPQWPALVSGDVVGRAPAGATPEVFLPVHDTPQISLYAALNRIRFYTWGDEECCLPRGATRATLVAPEPLPLRSGDILILEEVRGPRTGAPEHADPMHRHAVRLTTVTPTRDPLPPADRAPPPVLVDVEWMAEDALPFPLCLSALDPNNGCAPIHDVSVARGNVVLVDHGRWVAEDLGPVEVDPQPPSCTGPGRVAWQAPRARPFRPTLTARPLTSRAPLPRWPAAAPASVMLRQDPRLALPTATLLPSLCPRCAAPTSDASQCATCGAVPIWTPRPDLLESAADDPHFVAEPDDEGFAHLRLGDGVNGLAATPGTTFLARYRVGHGPTGNVPAEAITHVQVRGETDMPALRVRNPTPATGGTAPESSDAVRTLAPASLRARRERAVTAEDYAELAVREQPALQRASAALRWTGSWYEALVGLDPARSENLAADLQAAVIADLERYRRIGHDLRVEAAQYVPLRVALTVCARPEQLRGHVRRAVEVAVIAFFAPDRWSFAQPLVLSALVAAVQAVPGVLDVTVTRMERQFDGDRGELANGELWAGPLEILQLCHDSAQPEHGILELELRGGR